MESAFVGERLHAYLTLGGPHSVTVSRSLARVTTLLVPSDMVAQLNTNLDLEEDGHHNTQHAQRKVDKKKVESVLISTI